MASGQEIDEKFKELAEKYLSLRSKIDDGGLTQSEKQMVHARDERFLKLVTPTEREVYERLKLLGDDNPFGFSVQNKMF